LLLNCELFFCSTFSKLPAFVFKETVSGVFIIFAPHSLEPRTGPVAR